MGFSDILDPAINSIRRLLKFDQNPGARVQSAAKNIRYLENASVDQLVDQFSSPKSIDYDSTFNWGQSNLPASKDFDLDAFIKEKFSLREVDLDAIMENPKLTRSLLPSRKRVWRLERGKSNSYPRR